jgi:exosortase
VRAALAAAALLAGSLAWVFWGTLASYLRDQHYQEHFLYLWVFLGLALWRTLRGPFRGVCSPSNARDAIGLGLIVFSWALFAVFESGGSNIVARTALVSFLTGLAVMAVPAWNVRRCLMHGLLMQLCFGLPYSVYFPLTAKMQWGVAQFIGLLPKLGLATYTVEGSVVVFPHYRLAITADCSGLGQALTFVGIAALGVLSSVRNRKRTVLLLVGAVALAWLSNLARVGLFVAMVAWGATWSIDDPDWHAALGFLVFLPFVTLLVAGILRTHHPWASQPVAQVAPGRLPIAALVVPLVVLHLWLGSRAAASMAAPAYWSTIESPPGHALTLHGPTEAADRTAYETPWLINARFADEAGEKFDLFHYATVSRSHLCVHAVSNCLGGPDVRAIYADPVTVDGKPWWRIALLHVPSGQQAHVYFAFEIAGRRFDDSYWTQLEVLRQRVTGGTWEVRLSRLMFDGPMPSAPTARQSAVLSWAGRLASDAGGATAPR